MADKEAMLTKEQKADNKLLNEAIMYATRMHKKTVRKGTDMPYIVHPLEVMHILELMHADKQLMAAGVLHDTVEDTKATIEDIEKRFGKDVAELVAAHTEKDKSKPWKERKTEALDHLYDAPERVKMLVLADKLANIRAIPAITRTWATSCGSASTRGRRSSAGTTTRASMLWSPLPITKIQRSFIRSSKALLIMYLMKISA